MASAQTKNPFSCSFCDRSYKWNSSLLNHLRYHSDWAPFECASCHTRFREKESLDEHVKLHSNCTKAFQRKWPYEKRKIVDCDDDATNSEPENTSFHTPGFNSSDFGDVTRPSNFSVRVEKSVVRICRQNTLKPKQMKIIKLEKSSEDQVETFLCPECGFMGTGTLQCENCAKVDAIGSLRIDKIMGNLNAVKVELSYKEGGLESIKVETDPEFILPTQDFEY